MKYINIDVENIRLDTNDLVFCFTRGGGDTFNGFIHLFRQPCSINKIGVIKSHQKNMFQYLCNAFDIEFDTVYVTQNTTIKHPNFYIIRKNNIDLNCYIGYAYPPDLKGLVEVIVPYWQEYFVQNKFDGQYIARKMVKVDWKNKLPEKSIVLTDYNFRGESENRAASTILRIVDVLKGEGYVNFYLNLPMDLEHYTIPEYQDVKAIQWPHEQLIAEAYARKDLIFVGPRSGLFDLLRFSKNRSVIIYSESSRFFQWWSLQRIGSIMGYVEMYEDSTETDILRLKQFLAMGYGADWEMSPLAMIPGNLSIDPLSV